MYTPLTKEQVENYLKGGAKACPVCGSEKIEAGPVSYDYENPTCVVECLNCHREWRDIYGVIDMVGIQPWGSGDSEEVSNG